MSEKDSERRATDLKSDGPKGSRKEISKTVSLRRKVSKPEIELLLKQSEVTAKPVNMQIGEANKDASAVVNSGNNIEKIITDGIDAIKKEINNLLNSEEFKSTLETLLKPETWDFLLKPETWDFFKELEPTLKATGWCIPINMSANYLAHISDEVTNGKNSQEEVDRLFVHYYCAKDFEVLNLFVTMLKEKRLLEQEEWNIINDCLSLLKLEDQLPQINVHNLIIPPLMTRIDRLWNDLNTTLEAKHKLSKTQKKHAIKESQDDFKSTLSILNVAIGFITDYIFRNSFDIREDRSPGQEKILYRNYILHGHSASYGNLANTIRAFLALEVLFTFRYQAGSS